jgi:hypothetical protein
MLIRPHGASITPTHLARVCVEASQSVQKVLRVYEQGGLKRLRAGYDEFPSWSQDCRRTMIVKAGDRYERKIAGSKLKQRGG